MKVLVTGGAGYIGSVAVERLLERGDDVAVLDNLWRGHARAVSPSVELHQVDLRDAKSVRAVLESARPEAVLHFAAATIVPESVEQPSEYFAINTVGAHNLLAAMVAADCLKFVFSSTAAVYGIPKSVPVLEASHLEPINPYGMSKYLVERMLPAFDTAYGMRSVIFRYFNVAGATLEHGEDHRPETHVIPVALQTLMGKRDAFSMFGTDYDTPDGTAVRDYVHVIDLVDAHLLALDRLDRSLGAFNLGTTGGFSVREIVDAVERVTGLALPIIAADRRAGDPPVLIADVSRAARELGWRPIHSSLEEMIGSAWEWLQRNLEGYGRELNHR